MDNKIIKPLESNGSIFTKVSVEPAPHIKSGNTTQDIMLYVIYALLPALAMSVVYFGVSALIMVAVCVTACVLFEYLWGKLFHKGKPSSVSDCSAIVTGIILAFNLPVTLPYYMAIIGCFVAIVVVKQMFGGIGQNFANPAIVGRIVLFLSFTSEMTRWVVDGVTTATPLTIDTSQNKIDYFQLLIGKHGGSLGETCTIALLIGFVILLVNKVITPTTPLAFILTVAALTFALGGDPLHAVLSGGLVLGAVFMVTDYSTTPLTENGKLIFGIGCGVITVIIRQYASMPEGVSFAILLMNILTPYIDKATVTKPFGARVKG